MIKSVAIAGDLLFPTGSASAVRTRNVAGGLLELGVRSTVLSMTPHRAGYESNEGPTGNYQGIEYERLALPSPISRHDEWGRNSQLGRKLSWFYRAYSCAPRASRRVAQMCRQGRCDVLIVYGRSAARLLPMIRSARRCGSLVLHDVVEGHRNFSGLIGSFNPIYWDWRIALSILPRLVDGALAICDPLVAQLRRRGVKEILLVPLTEDFSDLPPSPPGPGLGEFRLLYVGALIERDNPGLLLRLVQRIVETKADIRLLVVGRFDSERSWFVQRVQADPQLRRSVDFLGALSDAALATIRQKVDGLILSRRNNLAEIESFPTRLVEFLKTGRPVFVSNVGDIGTYLTDKVHAVLMDADDVSHAAEAVIRIAKSPDRGHAIGWRGRQRAEECFDRRHHARRLIEFCERLQNQGVR